MFRTIILLAPIYVTLFWSIALAGNNQKHSKPRHQPHHTPRPKRDHHDVPRRVPQAHDTCDECAEEEIAEGGVH